MVYEPWHDLLEHNDLEQFDDHFWPTVNPKRLPGIRVDADLVRQDLEGLNTLRQVFEGNPVIPEVTTTSN